MADRYAGTTIPEAPAPAAPEPAPATATAEPVEQAAPAPETPAAEPQAETPTAESQPDIWDQIKTLDPKELVTKHPQLAGYVGGQADYLAQKKLAEFRQQQEAEQARLAAQAKREELRALADTDPDKLAERVKQDLAKEQREGRERESYERAKAEFGGSLEQQLNDIYTDPEIKAIWDAGDAEVRAKLDWRNHAGHKSFVGAIKDLVAEHRSKGQDDLINKRAEEIAKSRIEAAQKSSRIDEMASEASEGVDLGLGGVSPGGRRFTRSEIKAMSLDEFKQHEKAIAEQMRLGLIVDDVGSLH